MLKNEKVKTIGEVRSFYEKVFLKELYSYCNPSLFIVSEENHGVSLCVFPLAVFLIAPNLQPYRAVRQHNRLVKAA